MKILVDTAAQKLTVSCDGKALRTYLCSTSRWGIGNLSGSNKTPLGLHEVVEKYGDGVPVGGVFSSRRFTGEIVSPTRDDAPDGQDLITTRILRLAGLQEGINKGGQVDSYARYIYIHGTPEERLIGTPASHGCVRMRNADIIELYDMCPTGTLVEIV